MQRTGVIVNAEVRTMSRAGTVEAVAWRDGRLVAVGSAQAALAAIGGDATPWDAKGATVLPGFIDAHQHPCISAVYGGTVRLTPPEVSDVAGFLRKLRATAAGVPRDGWVVATEWDELLLAERRAPSLRELDEAVPDLPVFAMHYSCHRGLANSRALEAAGIGRDTPDPPGGSIGRDARGAPSGILIERAMSGVESRARASLVARDADGFFARLEAHNSGLIRAGITRVVDAAVPADLAALYREALRRGVLCVPTVMMPVSTRGWLEAPWDVLEASPQRSEHELLLEGPIKLVFDGAPTCAMCLDWWQVAGTSLRTLLLSLQNGSTDPIRAAFQVEPRLGAKIRTGIFIYPREEALHVVRAAVDCGFAIATHAIGNAAVDLALDAYGAAGAALGRAGNPRLEHATFLSRDRVARIASIPGIRNTPLRWLLDAGVKLAGSSDFPVIGYEPLPAIRTAVTRESGRSRVLEPDQRIDLDEALAMYTRVAAEVTGSSETCGTLEVGKRADLVVLDRKLSEASLREGAAVGATVLGGEVFR
jgi:predicted amidohydrolase YtcJ